MVARGLASAVRDFVEHFKESLFTFSEVLDRHPTFLDLSLHLKDLFDQLDLADSLVSRVRRQFLQKKKKKKKSFRQTRRQLSPTKQNQQYVLVNEMPPRIRMTSAELVNLLHELLLYGGRSQGATLLLRTALQRSAAPWLEFLREWLFRGNYRDPCEELMLDVDLDGC